MLIGEYRCKIDEKGRIVIPSRLRKSLSQKHIKTVFITRGLENCLFVFPSDVWNHQTERLKTLPFTKGDPRAFTRLFFSSAYESKIDKQGRIALPQQLGDYAGLVENVVIIGVGDRLEIWAEDRWAAYSSQALESYVKIAETLLNG